MERVVSVEPFLRLGSVNTNTIQAFCQFFHIKTLKSYNKKDSLCSFVVVLHLHSTYIAKWVMYVL